MLISIAKEVSEKYLNLLEINPINNVYGLARSLLALGTFLTLVSNSTENLFMSSTDITKVGISHLVDFSLFNILSNQIELARAISLVILLFVIIGIYPRFTGLLHWYVSFSFFAACSVIDGGDQANSVMSLLLVPLTFLDNRKWHWQVPDRIKTSLVVNSISWSSIFLIRIQVCVIYLHAAVAKFKVEEWINGTASFYWFTHHYHGAAEYIKPLIVSIVSNNFLVVIITWGSILLELLLFSAILIRPDSLRRKSLLLAGLSFHFLIVLIHGLISFYFTMASALLLYLSNYQTGYNFSKLKPLKLWKQS